MSKIVKIGKRPGTGRADLLYFLQQTDKDALAASAEFFGYQAPEEQKEKPEEKAAVRSSSASLPLQKGKPAKVQENRTRQRFFRLKERSQIQDQKPVTQPPQRLLTTPPFTGSIAQALSEENREESKVSTPVPPSLSPWPRIWPFLRAVLGAQDQSRQLDLDRIVRSLARGEVLHRLPYLARASWAMKAQVLVDLDPRIHFFWNDFYDLVERLQGMRGRMGLDLFCFEDGPLELCTAFDPEHRDRQFPYRPPEPGTPILILSDLGLLNKREQGWLILGRRLQRAGLRPVVLMPCPERYWRGELAELFQLKVWDTGRRYPTRCDGLKKQGLLPRTEEKDPGLEDLLTASAAAVRVEPGLLRAQRLLFPIGKMDVGTEAAVWQHQEVEADLLSFRLKPEAKAKYSQLLKAKLSTGNTEEAGIYQQALECMRAFHHVLPPEIGFEEELQRALVMGEPPEKKAKKVKKALAFMWQVASTLHKNSGYLYQPHLRAWVVRQAQRQWQWQEYWKWEEGEPLAIALTSVLLEHYGPDEDIEFPVGFNFNQVAWLLDQGEAKEYELRQEIEQGQRRLLLYPLSAVIERKRTGSMFMARLRMINNRLAWQHLRPDGQAGPVHLLDIGRDREIPVPEQGALEIRGNFDRLLIDGMVKPSWANIAQGRQLDDKEYKEYFHLLTQGEEQKELAWCDPGDYPVRDHQGRQVAVFTIKKGFFAVLDEAKEIIEQGFRQPQWAEQIGEDQYGLYADLFFKGVTQRFRWIQPGNFLMGSLEDEPERMEREGPQHEVVLTESYWLADTACPQALWQAVTNKNPSHFKGDERPVEEVSWEDVQGFMNQLNKKIPGLDLDLPTEAQWEYACRAGTITPFFFGDNISTDQVNYDGNHPYADGEKGEYREETVDVKDLPCNDWGLYQMHGNVWEWCSDWFGDYSNEVAIDPVGPSEGRLRVFRGGSWFSYGRHCRSAFRNSITPVNRSYYLGFRLSQGRTGQAG